MPELSDGVRDVLLVLMAPGLYCLLVLGGRRLKRQHGVQLGLLYHLFALSAAVYLPAALLKINWTFLRHLGAAMIILGSLFLIALIDRFLWDFYFRSRNGVNVPKFLKEVVRLLIVTVAIFFVLDMAYDQTIKGLLIAPGIAAVVIGLAMQDLMGNIIAGVALQAGKSFCQGDWLLIENRYAEVLEINWRSTRFRTVDDISIEVPNREIARQTIVNLNRPGRTHAMRIPIVLDYAVPPTRAKDVLLHAAANAQWVLPAPKPKVFLKNFADSGIEYEIKFWMESHEQYSEVVDSIRTNVWYGLKRHGIRVPFPTRTVQLERPARDKQQEVQTAARIMLRQQELFKCLSDEQLDSLLPRGKAVHFGRGETVIQQGADGDSMFVLVDGQANVVVQQNGSPRSVAVLNSGDCFGEMSLLTGEKRNASVIANQDCELVEIGKTVLGRSLKENPELLKQLSELLARRQVENETILATKGSEKAAEGNQQRYAANFVDKLRSFFEL